MEVKHFYVDGEKAVVLAYLINNGRGCWYGLELNDFDVPFPFYEWPEKEGKEIILEMVTKNGFNPSALPHIEDADPLLRELYDNVSQSETYMWFVKKPDVISQEDYERRVDAAIKKYHLEKTIVKNCNDTLYTCFSGLQWSFSEAADVSLM